MNIVVQPGRYIVAVSGGVDSVALLYELAKQPELKLTVAHFDHGIRPDSRKDRQFVGTLASSYNIPFVYDEGNLGAQASEAVAREARYQFLRAVRKKSRAHAIITAHHQDDLIETALLNLLRGTGRKGLTSLRSHEDIVRPMLRLSKAEITRHANLNNLQWREDSTNQELTYRRNYVRHKLVAKLSKEQRASLLNYIDRMSELNYSLDTYLTNYLHTQPASHVLEKRYFIQLPHEVAKEVMAAWLRQQNVRSFDAKGLERLVVTAKTYGPGQTIDVNERYYIRVNKHDLALELRDR